MPSRRFTNFDGQQLHLNNDPFAPKKKGGSLSSPPPSNLDFSLFDQNLDESLE